MYNSGDTFILELFISLTSNFQNNFVCKETDMSLHVGL